MRYEYFDRWHRYHKEPLGPISLDDARRRHDNGESYCVVAWRDGGELVAFIEVAAQYYGVNFLDAKAQTYLIYGFEDVAADELFLKQAIFSEYSGAGERPIKEASYYFDQRGSVTIEKTTASSGKAELAEFPWDVSRSWVPRPTFGEYETLLQKERARELQQDVQS
jgi:hypothetical protein